jgi:murein L,D-transpeptidase YcbB/YkuD
MEMRLGSWGRIAPLLLMGTVGCAAGDGDGGGVPSAIGRLVASEGVVKLSLGDSLHVSEGVRKFYQSHQQQTIWLDGDELSERGEEMMAALRQSEVDGLPPDLYRVPTAEAILTRLASADTADAELADTERNALLAELDVLLSEGMARYAQDLAQGTVDPEAESQLAWEIPREHAPQQSVLEAIATGRPVADVVSQLRPRTPHYARFMQALARYRQVEARGGWKQLPRDLSIEAGDRAPGVALLRERFVLGPDPREAQLAQAGAAQPDVFDDQLVEAVKHFQTRHSIEADGQLGTGTLRELNHRVDERIAELRLNIDRWRWLPHELGARHLIVNVAGFEMEVVDNGRVVQTMDVVVGQQNWKTPIFADTMEYIVVNPYWNVPPSILEDEIVPALQQDPAYLERNGMERTSDGGVRQRPGPKNALGRFKFMFPNKDNIYLHDTPADHLFARTRRDFSHGCIRLERPRELAELLMRMATKRSPDDLDGMLETNQEQWIKLDEKLPVYILYFTAWVQEDGTVRFHHDVYGRDELLEEEAQKLAST